MPHLRERINRLDSSAIAYEGVVTWEFALLVPGLEPDLDPTGQPIVALVTLKFGRFEWEGWVCDSDETLDGYDFCFKDVPIREAALLAIARARVRKAMSSELRGYLAKLSAS